MENTAQRTTQRETASGSSANKGVLLRSNIPLPQSPPRVEYALIATLYCNGKPSEKYQHFSFPVERALRCFREDDLEPTMTERRRILKNSEFEHKNNHWAAKLERPHGRTLAGLEHAQAH